MFSNDVYAYYFGDNANNNDSISKELTIQAIKSLVKSNKDIDINKSIETLIKRIGNINLIDNDYNEYFNLLIERVANGVFVIVNKKVEVFVIVISIKLIFPILLISVSIDLLMSISLLLLTKLFIA